MTMNSEFTLIWSTCCAMFVGNNKDTDTIKTMIIWRSIIRFRIIFVRTKIA